MNTHHIDDRSIPAILVTDLYFRFTYHSDGDFLGGIDDYFDVVQFLKTKTFDIRGIILDNHLPHTQDGHRVLEKLMEITKTECPVCIGLRYRLQSSEDKAYGEDSTSGVQLLFAEIEKAIEKAKESNTKLVIITVAGLTDIAVALNRIEVKEKLPVDVYVVAGELESRERVEYNVGLDPKAFLRVMKDSRVSITWVPCDKSQWEFSAPRVLKPARQHPLADFLLQELYTYHLYKRLARGEMPYQIDRYKLAEKGSPMWSTPAFLLASGQDFNKVDEYERPFWVENIYVQFNADGSIEKKELTPFSQGRQMRVVTNVNADKLSTELCNIILS